MKTKIDWNATDKLWRSTTGEWSIIEITDGFLLFRFADPIHTLYTLAEAQYYAEVLSL